MSQPLTLTLARRAPRTAQIFGSLLVAALLVLPFLALLPATHPLAVSTWMLTLIGKILCYAVVAVALDLVWGYAGMLSLGHGIFFALGRLCDGHVPDAPGRPGTGCPRLCRFSRGANCPRFWWGTQHFASGSGVNCDDPRPAGAGLRLVCFPLEDQRGLFLHHDPRR